MLNLKAILGMGRQKEITIIAAAPVKTFTQLFFNSISLTLPSGNIALTEATVSLS